MATKILKSGILLFLLGFSVSSAALADDWDGELSADWFVKENWLGDELPLAGAAVNIDRIDPWPTIVNGDATPLLGRLNVGKDAMGSLTIENGGTVTNTLGVIGDESTSNGTVTVTGLGSIWTNTGNLFVGNYGSGTLTIKDGGTVTNGDGFVGGQLGSTGTVMVTGLGSTWNNSCLTVGSDEGSGTLTIKDGGTGQQQDSRDWQG